jgi:formate C-acetyltransferase
VAIKRAVYEQKLLSLRELVEILNRNWEGAEPLRQTLLRRMPKFGNEDPEADDMAAAEVRRVNDFIKQQRDS